MYRSCHNTLVILYRVRRIMFVEKNSILRVQSSGVYESVDCGVDSLFDRLGAGRIYLLVSCGILFSNSDDRNCCRTRNDTNWRYSCIAYYHRCTRIVTQLKKVWFLQHSCCLNVFIYSAQDICCSDFLTRSRKLSEK